MDETTFSSESLILSYIDSWSQIINSWYKNPREDIWYCEGPYVEITGTRPVKATCFYCEEYKECRLLHLTTSSLSTQNAFQVFSCQDCAEKAGFNWE